MKGLDGPPSGRQVTRRAVKNMDTGEVIRDDKGVQDLAAKEIYEKLPDGVKDVSRRSSECRRDGKPWHRHVHQVSGRAAAPAIYPPRLVNSILRGQKEQMEMDGKVLGSVGAGPTCQEHDIPWYEIDYSLEEHYDTVSDKLLESVKAKEAKKSERAEGDPQQAHRHAAVREGADRGVLQAHWSQADPGSLVDVIRTKATKSGPSTAHAYWRRKSPRRGATTSSVTPPLESLRLLLSQARTGRRHHSKVRKVQFLDVSRAHFCAKAEREIHVDFCGSATRTGSPERRTCAREAAHEHVWDPSDPRRPGQLGKRIRFVLRTSWFRQGSGQRIVVLPPGSRRRDHCARRRLRERRRRREPGLDPRQDARALRVEVKERARLGPDAKDDKSIRILNRLVCWEEDKVTYEADPRHVELLVKHRKPKAGDGQDGRYSWRERAPAARRRRGGRHHDLPIVYDEGVLPGARQAGHRLRFAAKERARGMSGPTERHWRALKRRVRYLTGRLRLVAFPRSGADEPLRRLYGHGRRWVLDHEEQYLIGLRVPRQCKHLIKATSSTQAAVSLSSGESEFYGIIKGAGIGIGLRAMSADLGQHLGLRLHTDASAGRRPSPCARGEASARRSTSLEDFSGSNNGSEIKRCLSSSAARTTMLPTWAQSVCLRR